MFWTTRKELKRKIQTLEEKLKEAELSIKLAEGCNKMLSDRLDGIIENFPFELNTTVYAIELRNEKGRFTKKNPSFEHSSIVNMTVDTKNYFKLVDRYKNNEVFLDEDIAQCRLEMLCEKQ